MPRVIDYRLVHERMLASGFRSLYHNSGAFAFDGHASAVHVRGWIGPDDPTIRPEVRAHVTQVPSPWPETLPAWTWWFWRNHLLGPVWVMPMSHWAYELDFGSAQWMPDLLRRAEIKAEWLQGRPTGDAIEFEYNEPEDFKAFFEGLLVHLESSDFALAFPGKPILCTVHHHKQLWWQTTDEALLRELDALAGRNGRE